ncbi:hypothetical protein LB506_000580 [Fusarium annulatum]|nr:hypothetical protein LB506_000580 [Fusarium annulatum]
MIPHRNRHHSNGQYESRHRISASPEFYSLDVESSGLDTVHAWLSQVHDYASHKDPEPQFAQDLDGDYTPNWKPNWKPHDLSVVPISRNYHQSRHSGNRAFDQRPTSPKSGLLEHDTYSESQHEPSLDIGSDKENRKRSRSRFKQDCHKERSNKMLFERQPRRKTRPDRYTFKDTVGKRDHTTESEEERPRKKSRSKKQEIRASRDIMNNFASGAIPNTRVTMRPNLTAGLFLNGRSSTYGRGTLPLGLDLVFSHHNIGADITLDDMAFIETCGDKGKPYEILQHITSENSSGQDDVSNSDHTSRSATELPITTTNDEEGEVQSLADDISQGNQQNNIQKHGFEAHSASVRLTETTQTSDYETPEMMFKRLIDTGIFDGTGILETTSHRTMEPNIEHHDRLGMNGTKQSSNNPTYQDKGVMADRSRQSTLEPNIQAATKNTQFHLNGGAKSAPVPTKASCSRYEQELPVPISSTSPQVQPSILPTSVVENNKHSIPEEPCVKQPQGTKSISTTNNRGQPLSRISERGYRYTEQNDRPGLMFPSFLAEGFNGEHSYHRGSTEENKPQLEGSFVHRGLQSHDIMIPVSGSPGFQQARRPLNGHISSAGLDSAVFPTVHSDIYSDHRDIQHDDRQLTQPDYCEDSETIQEFIKRIDGERNAPKASRSKWTTARICHNAAM